MTTVSGVASPWRARGNIRGVAQRELFLRPPHHFSHYEPGGVDPHAAPQADTIARSQRRLSVAMASTMSKPVRTARGASTSCAWG